MAEKSEVNALNNVNIRIPRGEFSMIMGPSGSGKTTLLHVLSSLDKADEGEVLIGGEPLGPLSEKELARLRLGKIGFVFQDFNLIPNLSVVENLLAAGYLKKEGARDLKNRAAVLLEKLGIGDKARSFPSELSGGQNQRAAIARSLINNPEILFADEPTGNLNSSASEALLDTLTGLNREGQTILMVTHELRAACRGERIYFLKDGNIHDTYNRSPMDERIPEDTLYKWLSGRGW
ncbi:MAG: ABC transporter ATP-binding protein [Spirochaetales bacterium]|nr:ABC transporter ATP-binding protein [Spirochaetales bacterium]